MMIFGEKHRQPDHWIPNTYEMFELESIEITPYDMEGEGFNLYKYPQYNRIKLLAPEDMYYKFIEADGNSNLYTNKGPGLEFYALPEGKDPWLLAHFNPWTRYNFPANTPVYNAVAYSHACYDSPRDFNDDLVDQRNAVRAWYSNENPYWKIDDDKDGNPDNINPHQEWGFGKSKEWDSTLAPGGVWGMAESNASVYYRFGIPLNDEDGHYDPLNIQVGGNNVYYPYTPNFTSKKLNETPNGYEYIHTSYSSGIDCVTIIQRSAGYAGNQYYQIYDIAEDRQEWGEQWALLESVDDIEAACWPISNGSLLIPGDILVLHRKNGGHCGIVQRILYGNDRSVDASQVLILDSSGVVMRVRLETSWHMLISSSAITAWSIGRLKHQ